ncbi:MAG: hypothetical protein MJZ53_03460 [Paludibacteraceae bacterium]|nr:hypothetical protein [Paludibacteraceae bacterium]
MKQKLFKCLTSNTMSSVMSSVMSRVSNECRMTLDRVSTLLLLFLTLSFGFNQEAKADNTRVVGVAANNSDNYTMKINVNRKGDGDDWQNKEMSKAGITFEGKKLYVTSYEEKYGGLGAMQFQLYSGSTWKEQKAPISSWKTDIHSNEIFNYDGDSWYSKLTMSKSKIYFNATGWSQTTIKLVVGHANYQKYYQMTKIANTKLYYVNPEMSWSDAMGFGVVGGTTASDGTNWLTDVSAKAKEYTGFLHYGLNNNGNDAMYYVTNGGTTGQKPTCDYHDKYTDLNKTQTIKVMVKKAGASSYTETTFDNWPATIKAKRYRLNNNGASKADETDANLTSANFTSVITSAAKIYVPTPNTGYTFKGWGTSSTATPSNATSAYEYTVDDTKTIYLFFSENTYSITATADPTAGGTVTPTTATAMGQISGGNITAANNTGYHFVNWTVGTATGTFGSSTTANTTFKPTQAGTVVANFAEDLTSVTISSNGNGTVSPASANVGVATTQSVSATPADGYHFDSWAVTGNADIKSRTTDNPVTLYGNGSGNTGTLKATFAETLYTITILSGTAASTTAGCVTIGTATAAAAATGKKFDKWDLGTGITLVGCEVTDQTITFHASQAATVTATYIDASRYNLNVVAGAGISTVTGEKLNQTVLPFTSNISATPKTGYSFEKWTKSGEGSVNYTTGSETSAKATVSVSGGSVTLTASATPNTNTAYTVKHYKQNLTGTDYDLADTDNLTGTTDASVTPAVKSYEGFTAPSTQTVTINGDGTTEVTYNYTRNTYTLTWAGLEGATTQGGTSAGSVKYGATLTAPIVTKTGYSFTGWNPTVPATMPASDVTYTAQWTEVLYDVTINSSNEEGATLKIEGVDAAWGTTVQVGLETTKNITVTPNPGYKLNAFNTSNGGRVSGSGTDFTVSAAGADGTVTANPVETPTVFFKNTLGWSSVYVTLDSYWDENGKGAGSKGKIVANGKYIQMTRIGSTDYYYANITIDASSFTHIAFNEGNQEDYDNFWKTKAAYREDWKICQPLFIPSTDETGTHNETKYYSDGTWDTYSTTSKYYLVGNDAVLGSWSKKDELRFVKESATSDIQTVSVTLAASTTYQFKLVSCADSWYGVTSATTITSANCTNIQFTAGNETKNCSIATTIAGTYTFSFDNNSKKLSVEYPAMPAPEDINVTVERYYKEDEINTFIETDPAYKVYTDEQIKLTIDEVAAPTGCTTYYQFGDNAASTERTYTISNITTTASSIEAKVFFRPNSGGKDGDATTETINYQGELTPALHLTTSWSSHNDEAQEGGDEVPENVTIYYSTTNYNGAATVTRSKDGADAETFFTVPNGTTQKNKMYTLPDQNVQRQTFVATATTNGRTFTATKAVSIYRLVEIVITDEDHLMDHYYMWENGTNPLHEETAWPGNNFFSTLGDAHIFYVKYPSYTHFVLNNGKAATEDDAKQTVDITLPDHSTCYTIGEKITTEGDNKGKYDVQVTVECPNKLYVGDIPEVSAVQGEGVIVSPQVDIDPLLNENDLTISFNYGSTQGITCDQRGRSFMVTATAGTGTYHISVTYSIPGAESVTKPVTINVTSAIMIQAKYGNLAWSDHNEIYIHYWGTDINATQKMTWKDYVNNEDRVYARIPLGNDNKINFQIYAWNMDNDKQWHITKDVTGVTTSGCYAITPDDCEGCKRNINREGENCWTAYYVEIDMNNGTVYRSNTVEDLTNTVSFFAPGSSESQAKAGAVRIICNGSQTVVVPAATFTKSGIYTAKITANGEGLSDVAPYTGDFYIRTDGAEGGWNNYTKESHKFTYFTPYEGALYDYYWVQNIKRDNLNIHACIGNDYNENLANKIENSDYTDGTGNITPDSGTGVNLRFGYNPETNYFERSILRGSTAGSNDFLNLVGNNVFNDKSCDNELNEANYSAHAVWSKFGDISNWVYEKNVYVKIDGSHQYANALLKSKAFNEKIIYQLGYTRDPITGAETLIPAQRDILSIGTTTGTYNIRVIYDFKTNRIVSAWSPVSDLNVEDDLTINADVLFVRHEEENVAQVNLMNNAAKVSSLNDAYFVLEIDGSSKKTGESMYWFSVPFDCEISSIFGVEGYVTLDGNGNPTAGTWGIQEYDGKSRAEKGWYIEDTQTFWRWMRKNETLKKGHGYILVFDRSDANDKGLWKAISREEPCEGTGDGCVDGKKTITTTVLRLYFPSKVSGWEMTRSAADKWVEYENWTCQKKDRKAQDSNWRLLGTDSYSNIRISKDAQFNRTEKDSVLDRAPYFVYEYHAEKETYKRYEAVTSIDYNFKSFNCYMVQFSGSINWNQYTQSIPEHVAARRIVSENEITNAQMTLSLKKGDATEDNTYIYMDARATTDFDNQMDLTKIIDNRANQVYSVVNGVEYAGNTLPVESQTIPLTVNINASGTYTFSMPDGTSGVSATLIDAQDGSRTDLSMWDYTVDLNKGTFAGRFFIEIDIRKTPTQIDVTNPDMLDENGNPIKTVKFLHEDQLYIQRGQHIYDATGKVVK